MTDTFWVWVLVAIGYSLVFIMFLIDIYTKFLLVKTMEEMGLYQARMPEKVVMVEYDRL